jgi:hypothetical protein
LFPLVVVLAIQSPTKTEWPLHDIIIERCEAMMQPLLAGVRLGTNVSMAVIEDAMSERGDV